MRGSGPQKCSERGSPRTKTKNGKCDAGRGPGKLTIVSLGPGHGSYLVPEALEALTSSEVIAGYKMYLDLIPDLKEGRKVISSGMTKEVERCRTAIDHALEGYRVALVSSGDAGIYGMAGLVFDICRERNLVVSRQNDKANGPVDLIVEVIPGVPAFSAAASLLGAPLMHDFAAISLSDHLTPWELIEKRLAAAASADFVLAIYNPRSKTRPDLLDQARQVLLRYAAPQTPAVVVHRAMREGQWSLLATLESLPSEKVDMQSIVIVGNSRTYVWNGWMVTPRGYLEKYSVAD